MSTAPPTTAALLQHFRPVFDRIAEQAVEREATRTLAHDAVGWLREARFGALRVPVAHGGFGASVEQLFDLLIELGTADSNLPQILRAHFGFIERLYAEIDPALHGPWLALAGQGVIFGNATTELGDNAIATLQTALTPDGEGWRLDGAKFYSTGTLYADWIAVTARQDEGPSPVVALVPADGAGVDRVDDWQGFGQRLSASGTTRFADVAVQPGHVLHYPRNRPTPMTAFFQLVHLATLAGIAKAIERDAADFVRPRQRTYSHGSATTPREDPVVQQVIGQLSATAFLAASAVRAVAAGLGDVDRLRAAGEPVTEAVLIDVELRAAQAQVGIVDAVLGAATRMFDVGGASALQQDRRLDRHWRNARTLASHNPTIYKARMLGDCVLNGAQPQFYWSVGTKAAA